MSSFGKSVRLQAILSEEVAERIRNGMWAQLEREHGPGQRTDHQEPDLEDARFVHHGVEWSPL